MRVFNDLSSNILVQHGIDQKARFEHHLHEHLLSIIGRLTPNIVHELNNSMQAIQGGSMLGLEEINDPASAAEYFRLIQKESARVLLLSSFVRSLYDEQADPDSEISIETLVNQALLVLKDDLNHKALQLRIIHPLSPIIMFGNERHLQLALIELFLNINQALHRLGRREYLLEIKSTGLSSVLEFSFDTQLNEKSKENGNHDPDQDNDIDLSFVEELLLEQGAKLSLVTKGDQSSLAIEFFRRAGQSLMDEQDGK